MSEYKKKKQEIIDAIKKYKGDKVPPKAWEKINAELEALESTDGLNGVNNLDSFYNIWKKNQGKKGNKNNINSWTAYALGMTDVKPKGKFLEERRAFARAGFPDIDVDFEDVKQGEVFDYLVEKYGRDYGGRIGTHGFLTFKSCVTRVSKALDLADAFHKGDAERRTENAIMVNDILKSFPKQHPMRIKDENGESHLITNLQEAYDHSPDFRYYMDKYPLLKKHTFEIENTFANYGIHAAGFVVANTPIEQIAPLRKAKKDQLATQWSGPDLESIGLIKFDILGLSTLTTIKLACNLIKENYDIELDILNECLPLDDEPTLKLYRAGNLSGVFQCEQYGMQQTMKQIGVDRFEDIMAGVALYRPGPMDNIPEYCARKHGEKKIDYFHSTIEPFVKPYIENTYGLIVFQEQIMYICSSLANFSVTEAYIMIKAIGKKKEKLMAKYKNQFIKGGNNNGVPEEVMEQYWSNFIVPFANYGFNACLDGKTRVKNTNDGELYCLDELVEKFKDDSFEITLESYSNGNIINDKVLDVFCTGKKEIYEIELDNGIFLNCTLDHKFLCVDNKIHTVHEILSKDLSILYYLQKENMKKCKIKSIKKNGIKKTYNLTMESEQHNYAIYDEKTGNSIISKNSHACSYGYISYCTAYLKANYPDEFVCATLQQETYKTSPDKYDKIYQLEKDFAKKMDVKFLKRDINHCKVNYTIEKKKDKASNNKITEIRPTLLCKGLGVLAAREIEKYQPYNGIKDLAKKSLDSKYIDKRSVEALFDNGYIKSKKNKEEFLNEFVTTIEDLKKSRKKGVDSVDIFEDLTI